MEEWLKRKGSDYEIAGPLRVMGYNSPYVPANRRSVEVEFPVRRTKATP